MQDVYKRQWDRDVARYLNSDAIPLYNPIEEYLNSTGHWDGKDRIRALEMCIRDRPQNMPAAKRGKDT